MDKLRACRTADCKVGNVLGRPAGAIHLAGRAMVLALGLMGGLGIAQAQSSIVLTPGVRTVLPLSGIQIVTPATPGRTLKMSASWSFSSAENSFDSRDVIDEFNSSGALIAGNWILTGYFTAGDCQKMLAGLNFAPGTWTHAETLWGRSWSFVGGSFMIGGKLDRTPTVAMCTSEPGGRNTVLYRHLVDQPASITKDLMLAQVRASDVLRSTAQALVSRTTQDVVPLKRSEVRNRGTEPAVRSVDLTMARLSLTLPDDGYFWLVETPGKDSPSDMLSRLAPSLPEVQIEVASAAGMTCDELLPLMTQPGQPEQRPHNLPPGWKPGPTLVVDGVHEMSACHDHKRGAVIAGFFQDMSKSDVSYAIPLLNALKNARELP